MISKPTSVANPAPTAWVYENYIDRQEVSGGLDVGYKVAKQTHVVLGYRYGAQDQGTLLGVNSPYDNSYQRILVGVEGSPVDWLKLAVMGGPDIRDFYNAPHWKTGIRRQPIALLHRCRRHAASDRAGHDCPCVPALRTAGVFELQHVRRHYLFVRLEAQTG